MIFNYEPDITKEDIDSVIDCLNSGIANPNHILSVETELLKKFKSNSILTSSGTSALHLSLISLGVGKGDEVICPSFTFASTWNVIEYVGATPIFVDSSPSTWCICVEDLISKISKNTKAIIAVDIFGNPCDYSTLSQISKEFKIPIVGDCAESLGSTYKNKHVVTYPDIACTSFNLNKIVTSCGGGAIFSNNKLIEKASRNMLNQNKKDKEYDYHGLGFNYRIGSINAMLLISQIRRMDSILDVKSKVHKTYIKNFIDVPEITFQKSTTDSIPNRWVTVIKFSEKIKRDRAHQALLTNKIESKIPFKPANLVKWISEKYNLNNARLKESKEIYERCLVLPSSPKISLQDIEKVTSVIRKSIIA